MAAGFDHLPTGHATGLTAALAHCDPAEHTVQLVLFALAHVPLGQATDKAVVTAQKRPAGQGVHCDGDAPVRA
jgi:hypothetical protein